MMWVISSPSISTMGFWTLIFGMACVSRSRSEPVRGFLDIKIPAMRPTPSAPSRTPPRERHAVRECRARRRQAGRGADLDRIEGWLAVGAATEGYVGFAVGRSLWNVPALHLWRGESSWNDVRTEVSTNYRRLCESWRRLRLHQDPTSVGL
jgi:hypothetical protein